MKITKSGKAVCGIILPENPTKRELFAAEELIYYIKKISGVELCVSDKYENSIIIGDPSRNEAAKEVISAKEFENTVRGPEGFIIKATDNILLLAGSSKNALEQERGTLYSVYELLERYLGCSLCAYSKHGVDAGEFVSKIPDIEIKPLVYVKKSADVEYRAAILQYGMWVGNPDHELNDKFISWLAKNRYNRILTWAGVYEGFKKNGMLKEAEKRGIMFTVGHHEAITMLLPPKGNEYFSECYEKTHPEYYKLMEDGTRYKVNDGDFNGQLILCMRNEELILQMAKNIVKWADENPQVDIISLWPHDGKNEQCCCEMCKKYTKSENYSYFVNRIAEIVSKERPHIKLDRISYLDLTDADNAKLSSSVIIDGALWFDELRRGGKPDGSCFTDSVFEKNILEWQRTGAKVVYYDYLMGCYAVRQKWLPLADEMQAVCKRFCEKGIWGLGTQLEVYNMWNHIFNFYCYGRTAYNTDLSMDDNLESFCKIFGEGAPYIKEIIKIGEDVVDGQETLLHLAEYLIKNIDKEKIYDLYEKALAAAKDTRSRNNIRLMRMVFRYSDLEVNNPKLTREVARGNSLASDETGELWYMHNNFDSFTSKKEGYGISFTIEKSSDTEFIPDYWYIFER